MLKIAIYILIAVSLLIAYIRYVEARSIFFPMKDVECQPGTVNLQFEDIYLTTQDGVKLNAWFIPADNAAYTVLFCHGNAGNIGHRLEKLLILHDLGVNVFIIDYRGYGNSQGKPSEKGIYLDAQAGYDFLLEEFNMKPKNIIPYGESLGSAVVVDLASRVEVGALIIESAFSRAKDMAKRMYPFLPAFLFSAKFDSLLKIHKIKSPKLFIHSKNDEIVPFDLAQKLYNAAVEPKKMITLVGGHNTAFLDSKDEYVSAIRKFFKDR